MSVDLPWEWGGGYGACQHCCSCPPPPAQSDLLLVGGVWLSGTRYAVLLLLAGRGHNHVICLYACFRKLPHIIANSLLGQIAIKTLIYTHLPSHPCGLLHCSLEFAQHVVVLLAGFFLQCGTFVVVLPCATHKGGLTDLPTGSHTCSA